ncbi:MAG TPA: DNA recombination protein RmuC, partial [Myxococcales bacterium]|nr:DNA recombination protein RmuC [Myxococcales bacterium]
MTTLLAALALSLALAICLFASARAHAARLGAVLEARDTELLRAREDAAREAQQLRSERDEAARALAGLRDERAADAARLATLQAELRASTEEHRKLEATFESLSKRALDANSGHLLQLTEQVVSRLQEASRAESEKRASAVEELVRPVKESLGGVVEKIGKLEKTSEVTAARVAEQVRNLCAQGESLRSETAKLSIALRAPAQRGRWGETQLRRTLDLAGLRAHVDFDEQPVAQLADGALRPDVVVRLPGGKTVLLDSKVPLEAYLRAIDAPEEDRGTHLRSHAAQLRAHVDALSRKQYWEAFAGSPEMAVLFLPSDGLLAAALEADPSLHEDAFARRIVLATPATLFALLLTIAHVWKQDAVAVNAREIANEGRELHKRIADLSKHLAKLGRSLESALKTYNGAVGSFD